MKTIPLTKGLVALVDDEDYERVAAFKWYANVRDQERYAAHSARRADGRKTTQSLHAFITGWSFTDHINGNGLDNRRCNLRPANPLLNMRNRRPKRGSITGYKGVSLRPNGRWQVAIRFGGRAVYLGTFDDPVEAALAYDEAARRYFGEFAHPNFPVDGRGLMAA